MKNHAVLTIIQLIVLFLVSAPMTKADTFSKARENMILSIKAYVSETAADTGKEELSERVMTAMASIPRHHFVPLLQKPFAYQNRPLPIGEGQTISQPYIVALMTDMLNPKSDDIVLEVGTGSGYQAAVLSTLVKQVFSIEIVPKLAQSAMGTLKALGYNNVTVNQGNGYHGWPEHAPFDSIIVTAGGSIPPRLMEQLKPGGRMVIPVGKIHEVQYLTLALKNKNAELSTQQILPVRFVPLIAPTNIQ